MFSNGLSVADVAAVTGRNNDGGWGNGEGWWVLIILFALFGGWGNGNGWGNNGGGGSVGAEVQRGFDTSAIITKLDGINNGLCSLGYDQLAQMNGINQNVMQTGFGLQGAIQAAATAGMQQNFALQTQLADCCCQNREAIAQVRYDMATSDCAIKTLINQVAQNLQWGQSTGFRDLTDLINQQFCALRMEQKDAIISELQAKLNNCDRDTALQGLASYIISQVRPTPIPAWNVPYPWAWANNCGCGCCGSQNNGCGCGC